MPWNEKATELIHECAGKSKSTQLLNPYFDTLEMKRVVVAYPVKGEIQGEDVLSIVYGINHDLYEPNKHKLVTAASCTSNCLAPVVKALTKPLKLSLCITTLHELTNTQIIIDSFKPD